MIIKKHTNLVSLNIGIFVNISGMQIGYFTIRLIRLNSLIRPTNYAKTRLCTAILTNANLKIFQK